MTTYKALLLIWLLIPIIANAQIRIGTITGTVTDPAGARVAGAKLTLSNPIVGFEEIRVTDANGEFAFNNLPFATYSFRVEAIGFRSASLQLSVRSNLPVILQSS